MTPSPTRGATVRALVVAVVVALAVAVSVVASGAAAQASGKGQPLVLTSASPTPGATDVATPNDGVLELHFSQPLKDFPDVSVIDETTGQQVALSSSLLSPNDTLLVFVGICTPDGSSCGAGMEPGTTYDVTLGGKGKARVESASKAVLSGSEVPDVTVSKGVATYSFTTAPES